jgi:competence protein ComEC
MMEHAKLPWQPRLGNFPIADFGIACCYSSIASQRIEPAMEGHSVDIYTLNVGQGQFVVVTGKKDALIVDTFLPLNSMNETVHVIGALASILHGKRLVGLMVTGFDADHFCEPGMKTVLNKYRPDWIMHPKYYKNTSTADSCFRAIKQLEGTKQITKHLIELSQNATRFFNTLTPEFSFEVFSPHAEDMNSSNNCSIVCKINELATGATYLVTGDTEAGRWKQILRIFGSELRAAVLAAPHHGSRTGIATNLIGAISPHTVLISAGIGSQYGHPHVEALTEFQRVNARVYATNTGGGQSLKTEVTNSSVSTTKFTS